MFERDFAVSRSVSQRGQAGLLGVIGGPENTRASRGGTVLESSISKLDSLSQIPGFRWACPNGTNNFQATTTPLQFNHPIIRRLFRREPEQTADDWMVTNDLPFGS